MKSSLLMEFSVDKENSKVVVKREFAAPLSAVWAAWTQSDILDKWWAPKPYKTITKTMDFREGGHWLYAMKGPDGALHWCRADYLSITPEQQFKSKDAFCDEQGKVSEDFPRSNWTVGFSNSNGSTLVNVEIKHEKLADLEKIIEMGFKEGFTAALGNLDELLGE